ncbi:MAG: UDP-N-acetylglucosamine--N-acetylmuramyl-(pentapeptide) pyrophosphoryl-undecaprenol N-acetylglucosamine transferase, partial [Spirochaetes bacterium]|nr:UDP-N-acetylglucosamine--N-acetylmuramyl-(pentapeptide) pyrophosphoryl-undecaprenol N-acetylglucosamine transferase [Spirochaetota bacterium]
AGIERKILEKHQIAYQTIPTGKLRRYFSFKNFIDIFRVINGILKSLSIISKFQPDIIFSTGGFVSVPPVIAGRILNKKIVIHEQTIDAGLANKINARFAHSIALTFEESQQYFPRKKSKVTGIPLRADIFSGIREESLKRLKLNSNLPTLYFSGGGLGCHLLNVTAKEIIPSLLTKANVIFQTGNALEGKDYLTMLKFRETLASNLKNHFIVYNFINEELSDVFAVADLAIARSGAGTVNELMALGIPSIFVPLAIATNNEQYKNAEIMCKTGGAIIIEEKKLNSQYLYEQIEKILLTDKLQAMKENIKKSPSIRGNDKILELILSLL